MEKRKQEQMVDEFSIPVTRFEVNLISNIVYIALNHLNLDDYSHKKATEFIVKLQKAARSLSKQAIPPGKHSPPDSSVY